MVSEKDLSLKTPQWCPGCGHYGFLTALKKAIAELNWDPTSILLVSGIGCSGRISYYVKVYGFHTLHGRPIPAALAAKLVNPKLNVIAVSGDGDAFALGMSHFIHAARRNPDITYVVLNNMIYGLTTGQVSPTSLKGMKTKTTPRGNVERPVNAIKLAMMAGATFVARGFSGDIAQLVELTKMALQHKGFSYLEVLSPCVTFNRVATYQWFREHIINVDKLDDYDPTDYPKVMSFLSRLKEDEYPTGLIYINKEEKTLREHIVPGYETPIPELDLEVKNYRKRYEELFREFE